MQSFTPAVDPLVEVGELLTLTVDGWSKADQGSHIIFACTSKTTKMQWSMQRRYREFRALFEQLKNEGPAKALKAKGQLTIPFPEKKFGALGAHALESRRVLLQSFLQLVLGLYLTNVLSHDTAEMFRSFIGLDGAEQGELGQAAPQDPSELSNAVLGGPAPLASPITDTPAAAAAHERRVMLEQKCKEGKPYS